MSWGRGRGHLTLVRKAVSSDRGIASLQVRPFLCSMLVTRACFFFYFPGQLGEKQVPSSTSDDRVKDEFSDLSEG